MPGSVPWITPPSPQTFAEDSPQVTIGVGTIDFTDAESKIVEVGDSLIDDYMIVSHFERDRRAYMMPLSSPGATIGGDTVAFCALSRPSVLWVVDWTVLSSHAEPVAPAKTSDANWVWLDEWLEPVQLGIAPDGVTPRYRLSGTYFYGCRRPSPELFQDVTFPRPPFMQDVFTRTLNSQIFQPNLASVENQGGAGLEFVVQGG